MVERYSAGVRHGPGERERRFCQAAHRSCSPKSPAVSQDPHGCARQYGHRAQASVRVDDPGAEPTFTQDMLKGASWAYSWNTDTRKATLILPASHASDGRSHKQEGVVSVHRGGFFTIVSSLPGAVWTHAIYPETGRLLASQSTTKNGTVLSGRMLVGTCTMPP